MVIPREKQHPQRTFMRALLIALFERRLACEGAIEQHQVWVHQELVKSESRDGEFSDSTPRSRDIMTHCVDQVSTGSGFGDPSKTHGR